MVYVFTGYSSEIILMLGLVGLIVVVHKYLELVVSGQYMENIIENSLQNWLLHPLDESSHWVDFGPWWFNVATVSGRHDIAKNSTKDWIQ